MLSSARLSYGLLHSITSTILPVRHSAYAKCWLYPGSCLVNQSFAIHTSNHIHNHGSTSSNFAVSRSATNLNKSAAQRPLPVQLGHKTHGKSQGLSKSLPFVGGKVVGPPAPSLSTVYPNRLLIYHVGLGGILWTATFRLAGIFFLIYCSVLIAPRFWFSPFESTWMVIPVVVFGALPLTFMAFATPPLVTFVHVALPAWARHSKDRLLRYANNLPASAELDFTTLRWIWPRVTRLNAVQLYFHRNRLGAFTLRRTVPENVLEARRWYDWRPIKKFTIFGKPGKVTEPAVWDAVLQCIRLGWPAFQKEGGSKR